MIEIIKSIIDLISIFINGLFNLEIELFNSKHAPLGYIVIAFIVIIVAIYLIFDALGLKGKGDD